MTWSVNLLAARAVALYARDAEDARLLLDALGIVADGRILPDDTRIYEMRHPTSSRPDTGDRLIYQRDKASQAPPGLAVLPPVEVAVKAARKERERKPKRKRVRPPRKRPEVAECGTRSGFERHLRMKEAVCEPCRLAKREYRRAYDKARKEREREGRPVQVRERAPCGTRYGYNGHKYRREPACAPCKEANATHQRELYAQRRAAEGFVVQPRRKAS